MDHQVDTNLFMSTILSFHVDVFYKIFVLLSSVFENFSVLQKDQNNARFLILDLNLIGCQDFEALL